MIFVELTATIAIALAKISAVMSSKILYNTFAFYAMEINIDFRDLTVRKDALSALLRLTQQQGACRPAIGNHKGLEVFIANLNKAGGGHTKTGLPFLKCIACCTREAINRTKLKDLGVFEIFEDTLKRSQMSEQEQDARYFHEAKNIIISSLTNYYYDDESLLTMVSLNYCSYMMRDLKDTLLYVEQKPSSSSMNSAAFSYDLPTFMNRTKPIPSEVPIETQLQTMKRLTGSSPNREELTFSGAESPLRPNSPESMGAWSPPSSPPHRVFKRRRKGSRSPIGSESESELSAPEMSNPTSDGLDNLFSGSEQVSKPSPTRVNPRPNSSEESSLLMIQRFMICQSPEIQRLSMEQICSSASMEGMMKYFGAGANLSWVFNQIVNRTIEYSGKNKRLTELISCSFPALIASAVAARKRVIPPALDDNELEMAPVISKWLTLFAQQSAENSFCYDLCLDSDSQQLRLSAARCIPFLLSEELPFDETFRPFLRQSIEIIIENDDQLSLCCWPPIVKLWKSLDLTPKSRTKTKCLYNCELENLTRLNDSMVPTQALCELSPVFSTMLNGEYSESKDGIVIECDHQDAIVYLAHFVSGCYSCLKVPISDFGVILEIDDLFQKYMMPLDARNKMQHELWPILKAALLKSPKIILEKISRDLAVDPTLCGELFWPLEICKTLFEEEHNVLLKELLKQSKSEMNILISSLL